MTWTYLYESVPFMGLVWFVILLVVFGGLLVVLAKIRGRDQEPGQPCGAPPGGREAMTLVLRRANASRPSGSWQDEDYDVFDGERDVGRIFRQVSGAWWWGVGFQLTGRKAYGTADTREEAMAAFRAGYERLQRERS